MKKVLLICPHFMGYDEKIVSHLKQLNYEVYYIDSEKYLSEIRRTYKEKNILLKILLKIFPYIKHKYRENMIKTVDNIYIQEIEKVIDYDIVLVINGDGISNEIYNNIRINNKRAIFILYIWDDIKGLFKFSHYKYFDKVFSYNIEDCSRYGFRYLSIFTEHREIEKIENRKYDISIVATANKQRIKMAKRLYNKYKDKYNFYIYFYSPDSKFEFFAHKEPMNFQQYMSILAESKATLEVVRHKQKGPTTRNFDALETGTKIITNNKHITKYDFCDSNIFIINRKCSIPFCFLNEKYNQINYNPVYINKWIQEIFDLNC